MELHTQQVCSGDPAFVVDVVGSDHPALPRALEVAKGKPAVRLGRKRSRHQGQPIGRGVGFQRSCDQVGVAVNTAARAVEGPLARTLEANAQAFPAQEAERACFGGIRLRCPAQEPEAGCQMMDPRANIPDLTQPVQEDELLERLRSAASCSTEEDVHLRAATGALRPGSYEHLDALLAAQGFNREQRRRELRELGVKKRT